MKQREFHQHDLKPAAAKRLVGAADIEAAPCVLELGPGLGALAAELLRAGAQLRAVELDSERAVALRKRFADEMADGSFQLLVGDGLHMQPKMAPAWQIVANPPFKHSSALLRRWLLEDLPDGVPIAMTLMLQLQAAQKCASEGTAGWTRLGVLCQLYGSLSIDERYRRDDVEPPSHVPLAVMHLSRHEKAPSPAQLRRVDSLLEMAFSGHQSVKSALRSVATNKILQRQSDRHHYRPDGPARMVPPAGWLDLAEFLHSIGKIP